MSSITVESLISHMESGDFRVPPISEVAIRVTELASMPDASAATIVELVHRDPGLASELLRYSNSVVVGARVEIVSVHQAIVQLGIQRVSEVALAASLRSGVFDGSNYAALAKAHWSRSIATALVARKIARLLAQNVEVSFLCGLLWKVGSTLTLRAIGEVAEANRIPEEGDAEILAEELNEHFREAAIEAWNLPRIVANALAKEYSAAEKSVEASIASLASCMAADLLATESFDVEALCARPEAERLNLYPEQFDELAACSEELRVEIGAMP